jgi:RNA polymerase sigma-70 factor (ECF subfamily)
MKTTEGLSETVLYKRMKEGDHTAFEIIFRSYYAGLVVFSNQFLQDRDAAEELVQGFFVTLWEKRRQINENAAVRSYLFTSIRNRSLNYLKHKSVEKDVLEKLEELASSHPVFYENVYLRKELRIRILESIEALPPRAREVFIMSRNQGMSNDEIADKLQISKRTVEKHISQALKALRKNLVDYATIAFALFNL